MLRLFFTSLCLVLHTARTHACTLAIRMIQIGNDGTQVQEDPLHQAAPLAWEPGSWLLFVCCERALSMNWVRSVVMPESTANTPLTAVSG